MNKHSVKEDLRLLLGLGALFAALSFGGEPSASAAGSADKLTGFKARKVTVTSTARSVRDLVGGDCGCATEVLNEATTIMCLGGADVDCSTKFRPICDTNCKQVSYSVPASAGDVWLKSSGADITTVYITCGGGC